MTIKHNIDTHSYVTLVLSHTAWVGVYYMSNPFTIIADISVMRLSAS